MATNKKAFILSIHELPRRSGEYLDYKVEISLDHPFGLEMISIPARSPISLSVTATSVDEGILVRGHVRAEAIGECSRCLARVDMSIDQGFDELYEYESKASALTEEDVETDQILMVTEETVDLAIPVRDAVILALPVNPLCDESCEGLCSICGLPWRELPEDHAHQESDPRWKALEGLKERLKNPSDERGS